MFIDGFMIGQISITKITKKMLSKSLKKKERRECVGEREGDGRKGGRGDCK